jgi:hypothetical protein
MYLRVSLLSVFFVFGWSTAAGHPVSFKGSVGVMGHHSPMLTHHQLNYSATHWFAAGVHHFRRPDIGEPRHATFGTLNFLVKRWNEEALQANIYGVIGAGQSELTGTPRAAGLGLVQFDIENRRYYFLVKHLQLFNGDRDDLAQTAIRAGIAPYQADFSDLHSWLILEWEKSTFGDRETHRELTPFLRIFYNNLLFEIGQSFNGLTKINYISHF